MITGWSAAQVRAAEEPLLAAGEPLMLRAARALADHVLTLPEATPGTRVLVLAGSGSNGGDGLHAAAMLREAGLETDALTTSARVHEEGAAALRAAGGTLHPLDELDAAQLAELVTGSALVLDALLGIGGRPEVPAALAPLLDEVRQAAVPVIAVDLPSFLDATTGQAAPEALPARETVTFGAVKTGLLLPSGAELAGKVHLVELGLEEHLPGTPAVERLEDTEVRSLLPRPDRTSTKYSRGVVALAAGSDAFPGAAVLAVSGAARTGAGMVRCLAPQRVLDLVLAARPETVGHRIERADGGDRAIDLAAVGRTDALVVGPGLPPEDPRASTGVHRLRRELSDTADVANTAEPTGPGDLPDTDDQPDTGANHLDRGVIDAGALSVIGPGDRFGPDVVLTPHRGEAERLAARLGLDPDLPGPELARALAAATGATVLLKGAITLVAPGDDGPLRSQDDATSQLATAGTGDVLAGILGTLLAAGLPGPDAAALAALLHGRAGRAASHDGLHPLVALDVADHLPAVIGSILASGPDGEGVR